jgi:hypothetical protein
MLRIALLVLHVTDSEKSQYFNAYINCRRYIIYAFFSQRILTENIDVVVVER